MHRVVPYKEERVKQQEACQHLHKQLPACRGQLRKVGASQQLEERRCWQHRCGVFEEDPAETLEPPLEGRRGPGACRDPPRADALTYAPQRVQKEERRTERQVSQEGAGCGQVRRKLDVTLPCSHALPQTLQDGRMWIPELLDGVSHPDVCHIT